jgi:iron complex outermembrane receptor protein
MEQATPGYATGDVRIGWRPMTRLSLLVGVNNVSDKYFVNHLNSSNPFSGARIPEPGRSFLANMRVSF